MQFQKCSLPNTLDSNLFNKIFFPNKWKLLATSDWVVNYYPGAKMM